MKRVLIITYYWPPAGGGGVQRWLKFAKYLPANGWQPVIFTPEDADFPVLDASLESEVPPSAEVIRLPIWEPYRAVRKATSGEEKGVSAGFIRERKSSGFTQTLLAWIRGNLIIPDARRFWIGPSARFLSRYLLSHPVDAIVSTGPPHSMHLIAMRVSRRTGIPWLADFRDPWVNMDNADKFRMTRLARAVHAGMERRVLRNADAVVTVSWYLSSQYEKIRGRRVNTITNGFDHTDFESLKPLPEKHFVIGHYGTFGEDRNPQALWDALSELWQDEPSFSGRLRVDLIGPVDVEVREAVARRPFADAVKYVPYMPHEDVLVHMKAASVLLVILNQNSNEEGRVTGKIFEYLATGNAVLGIGSLTSDCARVIRESGAGRMVAFGDGPGMKHFLQEAFRGNWSGHTGGAPVMHFSRKHLTEDLVVLLDSLQRR